MDTMTVAAVLPIAAVVARHYWCHSHWHMLMRPGHRHMALATCCARPDWVWSMDDESATDTIWLADRRWRFSLGQLVTV